MHYYKIVEVKEDGLDLDSSDYVISDEEYNPGASVHYDNGHLEIEYVVYEVLTEDEFVDQAFTKSEDI